MKDRVYGVSSRAVEYGLYGLLFFLPISISIIEVFAGLMLLGFIGRKIARPDFGFLKSPLNFCIFLFLFFNALSMFNSGMFLDKSLHAFFAKWVQYIGIFFIVQDISREDRVLRRGTVIFLFGAFLTVLSGVHQYMFGFDLLRNRSIVITDRGLEAITSCFFGNNALGAYLVVVLSFVLSQLITPKIHRLKAYSLLIMAVSSVVVLFFTFSRGSWIAFGASLIMVIALSGNRFIRLVPVVFEILYICSFPLFRDRLLFIFRTSGDGDRFLYWAGALRMIADHPYFGGGIGTYMSNFWKYQPAVGVISYAHNCYLQIWAETGVFSLISFLAFIGMLIYFGFKQFFTTRDYLLLGLLVGLAGFLVHMFFEVHLYSVQLAVLFWVWCGMIAARLRPPRNDITKSY